MYRKENESPKSYKQRVLDSVSPSYCGAKWYNATIWLGSGHTASCHHPPPHKIPLSEVQKDPSALHNTFHKMVMRAQMLHGERPKECEYCWKIEGLSKNNISDRIHKSEMFKDEDHQKAKSAAWNTRAVPRLLEIAFDRKCQFACSYCNAGYSTRWAQEIKKNGPYQNLRSDGAGAYWHTGDWAETNSVGDENPFVQAFWKWWPELANFVEELKITGGEPLVSPHFWKFLDLIRDHVPQESMLLSINSNLGVEPQTIEKLLNKLEPVQKIGIYTSCDATGKLAEYIRDGLNYDQYLNNLKFLLESRRLSRLQIMITVSNLALYGLTEWLDQLFALKEIYGHAMPAFGFTIVRFPSFMSPATLPYFLRQERAEHIRKWYEQKIQKHHFLPNESETVLRLIEYLEEVESPHQKASDLEARQVDFKMFFQQYDQRRGLDLKSVVPQAVYDWIQSLPSYSSPQPEVLHRSDASEGYHNEKEIEDIAKRLGLSRDR
ncbi:MAG: twitch domain-containing radical SAM protein [Bdellovibrionia bacterium]